MILKTTPEYPIVLNCLIESSRVPIFAVNRSSRSVSLIITGGGADLYRFCSLVIAIATNRRIKENGVVG
jgi:hypothetical protein